MIQSTEYNLENQPPDKSVSVLFVPMSHPCPKGRFSYYYHFHKALPESTAMHAVDVKEEINYPGSCLIYRRRDGWDAVVFADCFEGESLYRGHVDTCLNQLFNFLQIGGYISPPNVYMVVPDDIGEVDMLVEEARDYFTDNNSYLGVFMRPIFDHQQPHRRPSFTISIGRLADELPIRN